MPRKQPTPTTPRRRSAARRLTKRTPLLLQARMVIPLVVVVLFGAATVAYRLWYRTTVFPGVTVTDHALAGKTAVEAQAALGEIEDEASIRGWSFLAPGHEPVAVTPRVVGDSDASFDIVTFDIPSTVADALAVGRRGSVVTQLVETVRAALFGVELSMRATVDEDRLLTLLQENFGDDETQPQRPRFVVTEDGAFTVTQASAGRTYPYDDIMEAFRDRIATHVFDPITFSLEDALPGFTAADTEPLTDEAQALLAAGDLTLSYGEGDTALTWAVTPNDYQHWIQPTRVDGTIRLHFDRTDAAAFVDTVVAAVDVPMQEALFAVGDDDRVTEFTPATVGVETQVQATLDALFTAAERQSAGAAAGPVVLVVRTMDPASTTDGVNDYGIRELIGVGRSNFAGSPTNRRKNIALGATLLHGQLIEPGEEFSLVDALGHFDPADGWLPELVIKGNRTIPEIGGGACQFGTTMFRGALDSGLPITERRNHSYTVTYYYPIGTDATIYDPSPDMRFLNDTGHYILLQTRIEGDELIFEFWGTRDGRTATKTDPVLSSWVSPPPKKLVETEDLTPGQVKCTEKAHAGVTASFDYHVTYADGRVNDQNFSSVYRPWQEVCLVGKTPDPAPVQEVQPTTPPAADGDVQGTTDEQKPPTKPKGKTNVN